jgi:hypothetical protein
MKKKDTQPPSWIAIIWSPSLLYMAHLTHLAHLFVCGICGAVACIQQHPAIILNKYSFHANIATEINA